MTPPSLRRKILPHMPMNASEAINFDTHKFVKHLTENGFTEQQAEVLAEEQVNILNSNLATKADIEKTNANIESLRQETQANIADLKTYIEKIQGRPPKMDVHRPCRARKPRSHPNQTTPLNPVKTNQTRAKIPSFLTLPRTSPFPNHLQSRQIHPKILFSLPKTPRSIAFSPSTAPKKIPFP